MPYFRTLLVRALGSALIPVLMGSVACGDSDEDTDRDGSVNDGDGNGNGTNGGSAGNNNDGTNSNGNGTGGSNGTGGTTGGSGTNGGGTAGGSNGETCGGFVGAQCPDGYFCNVEPEVGGAGCDTADGSGVCQAIPEGCPGIFDPVCTCEIRTYASACTAHGKGASVLHKGACTIEECEGAGGRVVYSDGASTPMCKAGEVGFDVAGGREPTVCCVKE